MSKNTDFLIGKVYVNITSRTLFGKTTDYDAFGCIGTNETFILIEKDFRVNDWNTVCKVLTTSGKVGWILSGFHYYELFEEAGLDITIY